jgi:hypothetical protein
MVVIVTKLTSNHQQMLGMVRQPVFPPVSGGLDG